MRYYKNGNGLIGTTGVLDLPEITEEEYAAEMAVVEKRMLLQRKTAEAHRPLTADEVTAMLITSQINTLAVDDNTALRMLMFYPEWAAGTDYTEAEGRPVGYKVRSGEKLWALRSEHTSQTGWEPGAVGTEALWVRINETYAGTVDDPIPYSGNMALENGLYYMQNYDIFFCIRDTVNPVYNALADLVGLYVEVVA